MSETSPSPRETGGRVLRIALILSLTVNLLILGLVLGTLAGRDRDGRRNFADIGFYPFIMALPDPQRRELGAELEKRAGDLRQNSEALRQEFEALLAALRADPYDPEAVRTSVEAQQTRLAQRQDIGRALLFERLEAMSVADRRAFADALEERMRRGPRWRQRDRD